MFHTYTTSSALWSIRSKGPSLLYSNSRNENLDRVPLVSSSSSRCCCSHSCSCCPSVSSSYSARRVPVSPRIVLYGLRQSNLIQCSFRRRLVLGGGALYFNRYLDDELGGGCCETSFSCRERYCSSRYSGRRRKHEFRFRVSEESSKSYDLGGFDEVDTMISLLCDEVSEKCLYGGERKSSCRVEGRKKGRNSDECFEGNRRRIKIESESDSESETLMGKDNRESVKRQARYGSDHNRKNERIEAVRKREKYENERYGGGKKFSGFESDSRFKHNSVTIGSRVEGSKRKEEKEAKPERTKRSSCSSDYRKHERNEEIKRIENHENECLESDSRRKHNSVTIGSRVEGTKRNEGRGSKPERTKSSSCSSYYSLSSSGELESDIEDSKDDVRFDYDSRKKSEKTRTGISSKEQRTSNRSSQVQSRKNTFEGNYQVGTSYDRQYHDEEEKSDLRNRRQYKITGNSVSESKRNYEEDTEVHDIHVNNVDMYSNSEERFGRAKASTSVKASSARKDSRKQSEELDERSEIRYTGTESLSRTQRRTEYINHHENDMNLTNNTYQEITEQSSEKSGISDTNIRHTRVSLSDNQVKDHEEHLSLVSDSHTNLVPFQRKYSSKGFVSTSLTSDELRITESRRASEKREENKENIVATVVQAGGESLIHDQADTRIAQTDLRKELQTRYDKDSEVASASQLYLTSRTEQENLDEEVMRRSTSILVPPSSQLVSRNSQHQIVGTLNQQDSYRTSQSGYEALYTHPERIYSTSSGELYNEERGDEPLIEPPNITTPSDALGSAFRSEQSSVQLIEEFVEKAKHETSASGAPKVERSKTLPLRRRESKQSCGGSGAKGPSDEMWVADPSAPENPVVAQLETSKESPTAIAKKSGRSFWGVIGDIFRMSWSPRAGSDSARKSAGKSSSNESVGSEKWFSGREHDGSSDDNRNKGKTVLQETASLHQHEVGEAASQSRHEVNLSRSSNRLEGGSASGLISSVADDQNLDLIEDGRISQAPTVPRTEFAKRPALVPAKSLRRSPVVKTLSESSRTQVSGSNSLSEQVEQEPQSAKSLEETESPSKDSLLKQRKLQRNKQVVKDRFDEWEEAYKHDAEQRKADEMFMREALVEAQKAADIWEVPVGAVLVHDGKIIARGYNLVEELRDSTAHAEMICIREGSNVLQSWRLAETTLYVTLEPCPMCAGAILQARINTLVYGAPNKLLGADGSWIRLFPGGEGNGSEPSDKPPPPVHPFHPKMTIRRGILESECAEAMQQFFQLRRKKKDKNHREPPPLPSLPVSRHHPTKFLNKMHHIFRFLFCL